MWETGLNSVLITVNFYQNNHFWLTKVHFVLGIHWVQGHFISHRKVGVHIQLSLLNLMCVYRHVHIPPEASSLLWNYAIKKASRTFVDG